MDFQTRRLPKICQSNRQKLNLTFRRNPGTKVALRPNRHKFKWHAISFSDTDVLNLLDLSPLYADFTWFSWIFLGFSTDFARFSRFIKSLNLRVDDQSNINFIFRLYELDFVRKKSFSSELPSSHLVESRIWILGNHGEPRHWLYRNQN